MNDPHFCFHFAFTMGYTKETPSWERQAAPQMQATEPGDKAVQYTMTGQEAGQDLEQTLLTKGSLVGSINVDTMKPSPQTCNN